ncbi:hypothetical protein SERLADRAFT_473934 [Serpula lacrymans var. lacrymans S7.9]|uniref:AMP-dependent synthetase/ligase domain-containing protein n=1 Tax=Serpula lacrymans var. lacrymans (strain S7.9) TaxID=578457 RepID=F8P4G4_SERL9|nr:uncharacterized protein SERLADRAFT_473934 [Serpula lacrymans var. lacrymans S7.9]EGO21502.1 hypothetical protein SERLADRAFT_473934 [Serpula lacrymans var. lacrymans S7.9]
MSISDYVVTDDLTVLLGLISVSVFLLHSLYRPQPLVHPILLGRQSEAGRVRHPGESAVYRNYGTGLLGRFPVRPEKDLNTVSGFLKPDFDSPRTLWSTKITNAQLLERISAVGTGLIKLTGLVPKESNVLLLLNDSIEFVISDFALSAHSIPSFTLSSPKLLSRVLESHPPSVIITHGSFLPHILELVYDAHEHHHTIVVVGQCDTNLLPKSATQVRIIRWDDVESEGSKGERVSGPAPSQGDVVNVSFFESTSGEIQGAQFTHENFTAGVTATRALFPPSNALSSLDTIASAHSLSTAFGRVIAYTALFEGASFTTLATSKLFHVDVIPKDDIVDIKSAATSSTPSPTVLFLKPGHVEALSSSILANAKKSFLFYPFAWRHKLAGVSEGFITRESLWDRTVFDGAREKVVGQTANTTRTVVVSGGPIDLASLTPTRIALSVPLVNTHSHPTVAGPVFASQPLDLQVFPTNSSDKFGTLAHVGAPSINVEAKLVNVQDDVVEAGGDPVGVIVVRGPPVGSLIEPTENGEGWVNTGETGRVLTNGAFKVLNTKQ